MADQFYKFKTVWIRSYFSRHVDRKNFLKKNVARIVLSMVDLLTYVIFISLICECRRYLFWKSNSPFSTPQRRKVVPKS